MPNLKWRINSCCCKRICLGCDHANTLREFDGGLEHKCPYCREPVPDTEEEGDQNLMERAKANDTAALRLMGVKCRGEGDSEGAAKYYIYESSSIRGY